MPVDSNCEKERRCVTLKKTNEKDQIINSFENALQHAGKITPDKLSQAIDTIVRTFDENETEMICSYISKRIGIAEDDECSCLSKRFNYRILPSLPEEYNQDYVIEGGVDYTLLKHSGYSMWHRPYFAMPGSTHKRITLNPHTKYGLDAGKVDAEAISFQEFLKLFDKKSETE